MMYSVSNDFFQNFDRRWLAGCHLKKKPSNFVRNYPVHVWSEISLLDYDCPVVLESQGASTRRMFSTFSLDGSALINVCQGPHLFNFLHSAKI